MPAELAAVEGSAVQQDKRWAGAGPPVCDAKPPDLDLVRCALLGLARAVAEPPDVSGRLTLREMNVGRQFLPSDQWPSRKITCSGRTGRIRALPY